MAKCLYQCCINPATHGRRCAEHHAKYKRMQKSSRNQPKCKNCGCCLPLSHKSIYCFRCIELMEEHATMLKRMDILDALMSEPALGLPLITGE